MARTRTKAREPRRRKRAVWLVALNVTADPHPAGIYQKLLTQASKRAVAVKLAGDRMAQIGEVLEYDTKMMVGQIWTYTQIDRNKPVLDLKQRKLIAKSELDTLLSSGFKNRGFNYQGFWFGFDMQRHILTYERSQLAPRRLAELLEKIFTTVKTHVGVEHVSVNVVQSPDQLQRVLALQLQRLEIRISRPNPDDLAGLREAFRKRLAAQHAKSQTITLEATDTHALTLDPETQQLARLGMTNGYVKGHGYDQTTKKIVTKTTEDAPLVMHRIFDPKDDVADGFFARTAGEVGDEVLRVVQQLENPAAEGR